jgi:hypothetical protein
VASIISRLLNCQYFLDHDRQSYCLHSPWPICETL